MNQNTIRFLRSAYKEYYFHSSDRIEFPTNVEQREFGYIPFGGNMVRHLSFRSPGEAVAEVVRQAPSSVYCSNALYDSPSLPMEEKGWKGAELIFDIDATDIPTPCKRDHDVWFCNTCGYKGRLPKPPRCTNPRCAGTNLEELHGVCDACLGAAKDHTRRLIVFLTEDFGVQSSGVVTYFSGNRGYHVHVYDARFDQLDSPARAEIADYVRGAGMIIPQGFLISLRRRHGLEEKGASDDLGWLGRITNSLQSSSNEVGEEGKRNNIQARVNKSIEAQVALIDTSVTTDVHRVFRLPGTLHGSTGMLKMRVQSLDTFEPLSQPVVLGDSDVKVRARYSTQFTLKGEKFGPFKSESVTVPTYAAVYLLARGLAEVN